MGKILVTGGAGYIGSHTCVELLDHGYELVIVDNFDNSSPEALKRIEELTSRSFDFVELDLRDTAALEAVFAAHDIDSVVHFAGLKAVGESVEQPLLYYSTNIGSTISLLEVMHRHGVHRMVFSSSCTVYGDTDQVPITETAPTVEPASPYGRTKMIIEDMLREVSASDPAWRFCMLRYFNPVGAHESGRIGEDPEGIPNNLMPFIMQVAVGQREKLRVFGDDYPTRDGTAVRDYIHVVDLARGHLAALDHTADEKGVTTYNLGTGVGSTVLEVIAAAEEAVGRAIPYEIVGRRAGDATEVFADPGLAAERLGWRAERTLRNMVADHWRWQESNPAGY